MTKTPSATNNRQDEVPVEDLLKRLVLTGADIVIHYDPWWNVAAQNQATDRAYRIGQVNPVQVYRLIAKDTLEEKILLLQENTRELAESVIREETGQPALLTPELLLDILD